MQDLGWGPDSCECDNDGDLLNGSFRSACKKDAEGISLALAISPSLSLCVILTVLLLE